MNFQQLFIILWSRKQIVTFALLATVLTTLIVSLILPKQYIATASLVIDQRGTDPITGTSMHIQLVPGYMATQVDIISSHNVAKKVVDKLKLAEIDDLREGFFDSENQGNIEDWIADLLLENIQVVPSRESSLIEINYTATESQFSAIAANAFSDAYIQTSIELRAQPAKHSANWFESQIDRLRKRVEDTRHKLSSFQQIQGIVAVDDKLDLENTRLIDLSRQLVQSQALTSDLTSRQAMLKTVVSQGRSYQSIQEVIKSPLIQSLKTDLSRIEAKFAELSKRVKRNHPQYKQTQAEVSNLKQKLYKEVKIVLDSISSSADSSRKKDAILINAIAEQKSKVLNLKKQRDEIAVLSREVDNDQLAYDKAKQRSVQIRMESELNQTNVAILNPAIPPQKHAKPQILINLIIAIFLGSLLGLGAALIMELLDRRVRSSLDLADSLSIPVFAVISGKENLRPDNFDNNIFSTSALMKWWKKQ